MIKLPNLLFRGDSDPYNDRKLKATFKSGPLLTNLISGGNGREILSHSISELANTHISVGWKKTHFLSFSTDEDIATNYGCNAKVFEETYDDNYNWDFVTFSFDTTILIQDSIQEIQPGIYSANFLPVFNEFLPFYKIILIDAAKHLRSIHKTMSIDTSLAIDNAERDKEWLILPANPFGWNGEYTGKLDTACITEKKFFYFNP